jgi:hypothetical protein
MEFRTWTRSLYDRGIRVIPPSHPTPVQVWAVLPSGGVVRFRCRGTTVTLVSYDPGDLQLLAPASTCACGCGTEVTGPVHPQRVAVRAGARPIEGTVFDGAVERGWFGYEAGLLPVAEAAPLFDVLLDQLQTPHPAGQGWFRILSTGRLGSSLSTTAFAASSGRSSVR